MADEKSIRSIEAEGRREPDDARLRETGLRIGVEAVDEDAFLDMGTFAALARMSRELKRAEGDRTASG